MYNPNVISYMLYKMPTIEHTDPTFSNACFT